MLSKKIVCMANTRKHQVFILKTECRLKSARSAVPFNPNRIFILFRPLRYSHQHDGNPSPRLESPWRLEADLCQGSHEQVQSKFNFSLNRLVNIIFCCCIKIILYNSTLTLVFFKLYLCNINNWELFYNSSLQIISAHWNC
jgi:hypothetical protein